MTKPTGKGRGGARPGAGRKPSAVQKVKAPRARKASRVEAAELDEDIPSAPLPPAVVEKAKRFDPTVDAQKLAKKGLKKLEGIIEHGTESGKIKAIALALTWGYTSPAIARATAAADNYNPGQSTPAPAAEKVEVQKEVRVPELGKKEARIAQADRSTSDGTFAVPQPPRLAIDNTRG